MEVEGGEMEVEGEDERRVCVWLRVFGYAFGKVRKKG
jgi:hypothetical protein